MLTKMHQCSHGNKTKAKINKSKATVMRQIYTVVAT